MPVSLLVEITYCPIFASGEVSFIKTRIGIDIVFIFIFCLIST